MNDQEANVWAQVYSAVIQVGLGDTHLGQGNPDEVILWLRDAAQKQADSAVVKFRESSEGRKAKTS